MFESIAGLAAYQGQIVAATIAVVTIGIIFSDRLHRLIAGAAGAALMVVSGHFLGFYEESDAIASIDHETLGLLLGMMVIVQLLGQTGFFDAVAIWVARRAGRSSWRLLLLLGVVTSLLSTVLDNVTTVVLMAPMTLRIAELRGINPVPLLIGEAILSNIGGAATLVGDPPNVIIGSRAGLSFNAFLVNMAPIVLVVWLTSLLVLRWRFRRFLALPPGSMAALADLDPREAIRDARGMRRVLAVLIVVVLLFFAESQLHLSPAAAALAGGAAALIWMRPKVEETLREVEWSVLLFFVALFVLIGGLEASGVMELLADGLLSLGTDSTLVLGLIVLWGVALLSAVVDNIPITIAIIPIIQELEQTGLPGANALWWALALGAGLGGNGTIIGATANIVVVAVSERTREPITAPQWLRVGAPVMLASLVVATVLYVLAFPWLSAGG